MPYEDLTFTREDLYERVWQRPVTQVAAEVGISDVALAKICRKLGVPVPPRGYWARLAAGRPPKRPALPEATREMPAKHVFRRWMPPDGVVPAVVRDDDVPVITVPPVLEGPHRLIQASQARLRRDSRQQPAASHRRKALDVVVGEHSLDRALRIMDALLKALEERGHRVELREIDGQHLDDQSQPADVEREPAWETVVVVEGIPVEFGIEEGHEKIELSPPPPSGLRETRSWSLRRPVKERIPNGRLLLTIRNSAAPQRRTLGDTKRQPLEARLGRFVLALEATAPAIRAAEAEAARRAEERRREQEAWERAERRRRRDEALARDLEKRLDRWLTAVRYRELADAVEAAGPESGEDVTRGRWLNWVRSYAIDLEQEALGGVPDPDAEPAPYWRH